jgi:hypothetical protein
MKLNTPGLDTGSSVWSPNTCAPTRRSISTPSRDSARGPAERFAEVAKVAKEPMSTLPPNTPAAAPAITAGIAPLPAPSVAGVLGLAELPRVPEQPFSAFGSLSQFKDAQRMALMLAHSSIVPAAYRGDEHIGDCVIALEIANRIGASILAVMQNLLLVEGKPGWSSQFLISCVNATRRFSPIRYQMTGTRGEDSWGCIAWAVDKSGEPLKSPEVTLKMAKAEGWYYRPGSKWKTMPELMLCYRSATLFTRLYAPEITMGIQTTEEVVEMGPEGNGAPSRPIFEAGPAKPESEPRTLAEPKVTVPLNLSPQPVSVGQNPGEAQAPASAAGPAPVAPSTSGTASPLQTGHYNYLKALTGLIGLSPHAEPDVLSFLRNSRRCDESWASLAELADQQPGAIIWTHDNWKSVDRELTRLKKEKAL